MNVKHVSFRLVLLLSGEPKHLQVNTKNLNSAIILKTNFSTPNIFSFNLFTDETEENKVCNFIVLFDNHCAVNFLWKKVLQCHY